MKGWARAPCHDWADGLFGLRFAEAQLHRGELVYRADWTERLLAERGEGVMRLEEGCRGPAPLIDSGREQA